MAGSNPFEEEMKRIEEILAQNPDAVSPEFSTEQQEVANEDFDIDPDAIASAESSSMEIENQLTTVSSILEELLAEMQNISETLKGLS